MTTFVDTNVLYFRDPGQPVKQLQAQAWVEHLWESGGGRLSSQVLNEFYVTVTRKRRHSMTTEAARADVADLSTWQPTAIDEQLISDAWVVEDRYGFTFWDALIVAAAKASGCDTLLAEDLQHGQDLDGLRVLDPFAEPPPSAD